MTTDKIIDAKYIEDKYGKFKGLFKALTCLRVELDILGYDYIEMTVKAGDNISNPPELPEMLGGLSLRSEPAKEGREGICKVCGKEGMYLETDNMMCDSCWGKPSEQGGRMLQPGEYMRDNEGNITTYEDEQKEKQVAKKIEKLDYILEGERPLNTPLTDANMSRIESKLNEVISRINSH